MTRYESNPSAAFINSLFFAAHISVGSHRLSRVSVRSSFAGRLSTTRVSRYSQGVRVRPGMDSFAETSCAQTSMAAASARDSSLESARDSSVAPALNAPRVDFRSVATR